MSLSVGNGQRADEPQDDVSTLSIYSVRSEQNLVPVKTRAASYKKINISFIVISVLVVMVFSLVVSLVVLVISRKSTYVPVTCVSEECIRMAASLKQSMDTSVDPCDDFYRYACGRWSEEHSTLDSNSWFDEKNDRDLLKIWNYFKTTDMDNKPDIIKHTKKFYDSCMDIQSLDFLGLRQLFLFLDKLDLPELPAMISGRYFDLVPTMAKIRRLIGKDMFVGIDVVRDPMNPTKKVILLQIPTSESTLPSSNSEAKKKLKDRRSRHRSIEDVEDNQEWEFSDTFYIAEIMEAITLNGTMLNMTISDEKISIRNQKIVNIARKIIDFKEKFNDFKGTGNEESNWEINQNNYVLVDTLQTITDKYVSKMNWRILPRNLWRPYVENVFKDVSARHKEFDLNTEKILVSDFDYMKRLAYFLESYDNSTLQTAVWWEVVDMIVPYTSQATRKIWEKYMLQWTGTNVAHPRAFYCAKIVQEMMGMAVSYMFVDEYSQANKNARVVEMFEDIKYAFARLVTNADWMDRETKLSTIQKSKKMSYVIGYPEWISEPKKINVYYGNVSLKNITLLDNLVKLANVTSHRALNALVEIDYFNNSWVIDPTTVNAVHSFFLNHITVPAAILQFPFYELGLEALNYGAIGVILGHELTHGFDHRGRRIDGNGSLHQWWSNDTINEFKKRTDCFVNYYNNISVLEVNDKVDGKLTLDENIADNGGIRQAVHAYRRWEAKHGYEWSLPGFAHYTNEQLLFLGFAHMWCETNTFKSLSEKLRDSHPPGAVRVLAVLRNSNEFSKAWMCPLGSKMNPREKCHMW